MLQQRTGRACLLPLTAFHSTSKRRWGKGDKLQVGTSSAVTFSFFNVQRAADGSPVQDASNRTAPPLTPDPSRLSAFDFHHGIELWHSAVALLHRESLISVFLSGDDDVDYSSVPAEQDTFPGSKIEGVSKEVCVPLHSTHFMFGISARFAQFLQAALPSLSSCSGTPWLWML
jgi:hypothetical protein